MQEIETDHLVIGANNESLRPALTGETHAYLAERIRGWVDIDERIVANLASDAISIGPYVLSNGDLPAMVLVDAVWVGRRAAGVAEAVIPVDPLHDFEEHPRADRGECHARSRPDPVGDAQRHAVEAPDDSVPPLDGLVMDGSGLLSDVEADAPKPPQTPGVLSGLGAAPGRCTARARVVRQGEDREIAVGDIVLDDVLLGPATVEHQVSAHVRPDGDARRVDDRRELDLDGLGRRRGLAGDQVAPRPRQRRQHHPLGGARQRAGLAAHGPGELGRRR